MELPDRELRQQDQNRPCCVVLCSDLPRILESKSMRVFGLKQDKTRQDKEMEGGSRRDDASLSRYVLDFENCLQTVWQSLDCRLASSALVDVAALMISTHSMLAPICLIDWSLSSLSLFLFLWTDTSDIRQIALWRGIASGDDTLRLCQSVSSQFLSDGGLYYGIASVGRHSGRAKHTVRAQNK